MSQTVRQHTRARPPAQVSRRRRALLAGLAVALSSLGALVVVEIGLRLFGSSPVEIKVSHRLVREAENPILGFELSPGVDDYLYHINGDGLRDRVYDRTKAPDTFRIAVVGDSIPYGEGVEAQYTFPKLLERYLNWRSSPGALRYEVLNFGVNGYGTAQEAELLRTKVADFNPDLAVISYCLNDPDRDSLGQKEYLEPEGRRSASRLTTLLQRSRVYVLLGGLRFPGRDGADGADGRSIPLGDDYWHFIHDRPEYWRDVEDGFGQVGRDPVPAVLVIFPLFKSLEAYAFHDVHAKVTAAAEASGIGVVDLLDSFARLEQKSPGVYKVAWYDDLHPNALGHNVAAVRLLTYLAQQRLIPDTYDRFDWTRIRELSRRIETFANYRFLGLDFESRRAPERAIEAYEQAATALPDATEVTYKLVNLLRFTGQNELARRYAQACVASDPRFAPGWFSLAALELAQGDHASAAEHYLRGLELEPQQRGYWGATARALAGAGRRAEALDYLERLAEQGPLEDDLRQIRDTLATSKNES